MRLCAKRVMGGLIVAASVMLVGAPAVYAAEAGDADNDLTETRATFNKDEATEAKAFVAIGRAHV